MNRPNSTRIQHDNMHGFTLIELMVTIIILAILTTAALPSFRSFILGQRVKNASFDLMSTLIMARSEAIKRNTNINVTPTGGSWLNGWTVAASAVPLNTQSALGNGVSVACYSSGAAIAPCPTITYTSNGRLPGAGAAPSIQLNSTEINSVNTRCISIDLSGRPNSKKGNC